MNGAGVGRKHWSEVAEEPCRDHLGVVEDKQITRSQQGGQIRDSRVLYPSRGRDHEQPSGIAQLAGTVRDQPARRLKIEIVETHRSRLTATGGQSVSVGVTPG